MTEASSLENSLPYRFNRIRHRGDPKSAITLSGHRVTKEDPVYYRLPDDEGAVAAGTWVALKCADYHGEHFVYIDPLYNDDTGKGVGHWFAMCTCGSPAVVVGRKIGDAQDSDIQERLLVCYLYTVTLEAEGHGRHVTTDKRGWT